MFNNLKKLISLVFATVLLTSISSTSFAIDKLHFIIGGGAGGGWDGTARGTGEALTKAGFKKRFLRKYQVVAEEKLYLT